VVRHQACRVLQRLLKGESREFWLNICILYSRPPTPLRGRFG
jgi:hypothetical protein